MIPFRHWLWIIMVTVSLTLMIRAAVADPEVRTKVKVVKVPEYHTTQVEKEVPVVKYQQLPDTCLAAIDALQSGATATDTQSHTAGKILLATQELERNEVMHNPQAINQVTAMLRHYRDKLSEAISDVSAARATTAEKVKACMTELDNRAP